MTQRVPIDWDDLELALNMQTDELQSYLDLRTGKVEIAANDITGTDAGLAEEEVEAGFAEGYLIPIEPFSSRTFFITNRISMDGGVRRNGGQPPPV